MTEPELVEAIASFYGLFLTAVGLYITVCSGYLIAAYLVGGSLTKLQTAIVSTLFTFVAALMTYASWGWLTRTFGYLEALKSVGDSGLGGASGHPAANTILTTIMALGIIACLKFMWDIRHPKTE